MAREKQEEEEGEEREKLLGSFLHMFVLAVLCIPSQYHHDVFRMALR